MDSVRHFMFGHSLLDHRPPAIPTPSDETTVAHWLHLLTQDAGNHYAATGQYGFLPQHQNLPPFSQWGYDLVPAVWESDYFPFNYADFTTVFITPANFIQWQPSDVDYVTDPGISPLSATLNIVDWVKAQEDTIAVYIYENWPDMAGYIASFPPTTAEFTAYNQYTLGGFHDWWIEYHDLLVENRPQLDIKMIPVGTIIANIYTDPLFQNIPTEELYEDDAPHGRASTYFLAGLISYMAINQTMASSAYVVPTIVHSTLRDNYPAIVDMIWDELLAFNDENGKSRVFCDPILSKTQVLLEEESILVYPNPTNGIFRILGETDAYNIAVIDGMGTTYQQYSGSNNIEIDISSLPAGIYFIRINNQANGQLSFQKIIKE